MTIQELLGALFNIVLVVMIVATMVSAGFTTTFSAIGSVLSKWMLVILVLVTGFSSTVQRRRRSALPGREYRARRSQPPDGPS